MELILFYAFSALVLGLALVVVVHPNPIGAAMSLVGSFFGVALLFAMQGAHFVAIMQLLLYAGAIMVLFVFVIMLLNLERGYLSRRSITGARLIQGSAAFYLLALLSLVGWALWRQDGAIGIGFQLSGTVKAVGELLLSSYVVPFEVLSVMLLVAILGAVAMGKRDLS